MAESMRKSSSQTLYNPGILDLASNGTRTGSVLGGGVEYMVSPAWSVKGEYQHIDLGSQTFSGINTGFFQDHNTTNPRDYNFSTVRVGINYRFGGPSITP